MGRVIGIPPAPTVVIRRWWLICLLLAGLSAWANRYAMDPDGMSYVEMASRAAQQGAGELVNGYWSPAYPGLIALAYWAVHPSPDLEFPLAHFVNFLVFTFTLAGFTVLVKSWPLKDETARSTTLASLAYPLFLWFAIEFIGVRIVTPDLLLAGFVFLAAAICCQIARGRVGWIRFALLGCVLGAGYYVKAVMLPIGVILLLLFMIPLVWRRSDPAMKLKVLTSALVFTLCVAPFVTIESRYVGHFSTGETGPLNYAWFADGAFPLNGAAWKAAIDGANGTLRHAPRMLVDNPTVLEFGSPIPGTYPLHYDASYWFAGTRSHINAGTQLRALTRTASTYLRMIRHMWALIAGAVAVFLVYRRRMTELISAVPRWLLAWPLGVCLLYFVVHTEERLVAAFLVLFWLAIYTAVYDTATRRANVTAIPTAVSAILLLSCSAGVLLDFGRAMKRAHAGETPEYVRTAQWLKDAGVKSGDSIAFAGVSYDAYYAHYLRVRIVAEIVDPGALAHMDANQFARVSDRLRSVGVKAILARDSGPGARLPDAGSAFRRRPIGGSGC